MEEKSSKYLWYETNKRFVIIEKFEIQNISIIPFQGYIFKNKENLIHRLNGNPSYSDLDIDAYVMWKKNGNFHRKNDLPAVIRNFSTSTQHIYKSKATEEITNNLFIRGYERNSMRLNSPEKEYWVEGKLHRENDLPAVIFNGQLEHLYWYEDGLLHRNNNKPAIINGNYKHYFEYGKLYKSEIDYNNKLVNFIMTNPFKIVGILSILFAIVFIFLI